MTLARRHRRYGAAMIYLKLRQQGMGGNNKRVERLYAEAGLQLCRPKSKKVPIGERQPLVRPQAANEVWSMDFVFDRSADQGRSCLWRYQSTDDQPRIFDFINRLTEAL